MGRKNRMKSTFVNDVRPGTFWIRHNEYQIVHHQELVKLKKEDVVIVLKFIDKISFNNLVHDTKLVDCYSQKMNCKYTTTLENFYFNYHKL